jgi:hypothetical protein
MLRRILLFIFLFGGGVGLLLFVTGNPSLFQLGKKDVKEVQGSGGDSGLRVQMKESAGSSKIGQNVGVVARGRGSLVDYAAENSKNEFRLEWEDSEPRSDGTYDLVRATYVVHLREKGQGSHLQGKPKIHGKADRLNIKMQFGEGGKQSIDREKEIHAFGFVMNAQGGGKDRGFSLGLTAGELQGRIRSKGLSAKTPSSREKVEIRLATQGKQFCVKGRGLRLEVDQSGADAETKTLDLTILEDIEVFDGVLRGAKPFLTAKGPLRIRRLDEDRILLEVENHVQLKSPKGQRGVLGIRGIEGEGERFTGLLCRGFIPGVSAQEVSFAWTEFRFHGKGGVQASLHVSGQELRGDHLGVALSPSSGILELVAEGEPLLRFSDDKGEPAGILHGAKSLHWSRPGARFLEVFPSLETAFGMGMDTWVQDVVVVEGRTVFEPADDAKIQRVVSQQGLRLFFREVFGRPAFFLAMAPGEVEARGGSEEEPLLAKIKEGLLVEPVGVGFAAGLGSRGGEFVVDRGSLHLEGKGWLNLQALGGDTGKGRAINQGVIRFASGIQEDLRAWVTLSSGTAKVVGIREAHLRTSPKGIQNLRFLGSGLQFDWGGLHAEGEGLRLLPNDEILLEGGSRLALVSRKDSMGRVQKTQGDRIRLRPFRLVDEWRVPVLVEGKVLTRVVDQKGGSRLSLKSEEQRFFPASLPSFLKKDLAQISLGSAGVWLADWVYGVSRIEAKGHVEIDLKKKEKTDVLHLHCLAQKGVSTMDASLVALEGIGPHGFKAFLEQSKKGHMVFEGKSVRFLSMGRDVMFQGSENIPPILNWKGEKDGLEVLAKDGKFFFHRSASSKSTLRVPGPVTLRRTPILKDGFELSCEVGVFVNFDESGIGEPSRWKIPASLSRIEARGAVHAKGNGISVQGERLIYDTKTQWVSLEAKGKGFVFFQAGPGIVWKSSPHLSVSLESFEIRGGYGSLEGGVSEIRR